MIRRLYESDATKDELLEWANNIPFDELYDEIREITGLRDLKFNTKIWDSGWRVNIQIKSQNLVNKASFLTLMFESLIIDSGGFVVEEKDSEFYAEGHFNFSYRYRDRHDSSYNTFLDCYYDDNSGWTFKDVKK